MAKKHENVIRQEASKATSQIIFRNLLGVLANHLTPQEIGEIVGGAMHIRGYEAGRPKVPKQKVKTSKRHGPGDWKA
jgi:hypothetical protein